MVAVSGAGARAYAALTPALIRMPSKLANWLTIAGLLGLALALSCVPAAFRNRTDSSVLSLAACLFSASMSLVAGGMYVKARWLRNQLPADAGAARPAKVRGGCELCARENPVIHCRVHELHLCGDCLADHYDFRSCVYVPTTRRAGNHGRGIAKARGA